MPGTGSPAPPLLLALETSGSCGSIALVRAFGCVAEYTLDTGQTHSRYLLPGIEMLMRETSIDWPDLNAIAVGLGPGSFTGLRIGLATAKGLAMAAEKPLVGVSSLDGLAVQIIGNGLPVCALIDARKKEVYAALYRENAQGEMERQGDYLVLPPARLAEMIQEPTLFIGSGAELYRHLLTAQLGDLARFAPSVLFHDRASAIGFLGLKRFLQGDLPAEVAPLYVRASDAELQLGAAKK